MGNRWDTGRTEAFSDGVFAFAITLLVLDIDVPESAFNHLWRGIAHQWPSYLGYATSFLTVGGIWLAHHGMFRRLQYANLRVMQVNLLLLMAVAFLPFPTKLVAEAIRNSSAERAAVIFYGASLLVISLLFSALWASVSIVFVTRWASSSTSPAARPVRFAVAGVRGRRRGRRPGRLLPRPAGATHQAGRRDHHQHSLPRSRSTL